MFNRQRLKGLEQQFLRNYPLGFDDPAMLAIGKKHKMTTMVELAQRCFSKTAFREAETVVDNMVTVISRSSMVSMFEKPKFRDFARGLHRDEKSALAKALKQLLHGKQQLGFESIVEILATQKLAKWSLVSIIPAYYAPEEEVFVKPTTAKDVLNYFEVSDLVYKPRPSWDFYQQYRALINDAKTKVSKKLSPSNAAFSGFLMMTVSSR